MTDDDDDVPVAAIRNDELGDVIEASVECPGCHRIHDVGTLGSINVVRCPADGETYLVGFGGLVIKTAMERKLRVVRNTWERN